MGFFNDLAIICCSFGLMVIGTNFIAKNLKNAFENSLHEIGNKCKENRILRALWGFFLGAVTQSSTVVIFIVANLVMNEKLLLRNALLLSAWGGIGASIGYVNMAFSQETLAYVLVSISGISFLFKVGERWGYIRLCVFGYGILFLGLTILTPAILNLKKSPALYDFISQPASPLTYLILWFFGILMGYVPNLLMMLIIGFSTTGSLEFNKCMVLIYGMGIGQGLFAWTMSNQPSPLFSITRKLGMFRLIYSTAGSLLFLILFYLEEYGGVPIIKSFLASITSQEIFQVIILTTITMFLSTMLIFPFLNPLEKQLLAWEHSVPEEDESKMKYVFEEALEFPETALDLVLKEEVRLIGFFYEYFDASLESTPTNKTIIYNKINKTHSNITTVLQNLHDFENKLQLQTLSQKASLRLLSLVERHSIIVSLDSSVFQFSEYVIANTGSKHREIVSVLAESLSGILVMVTEVMTNPSIEEAEVLKKMTNDRKYFLNVMRDKYLQQNPHLSIQEKSVLFSLNSIAERIFWLYQQLGENIAFTINETIKLKKIEVIN